MRRYARFIATMLHCLTLMIAAAFAGAVPAAAETRVLNNIAAELVVEPAAPGARTTTVAIHMTPTEGWHGYWSNPGDAGLGMTLKWSLPKGVTAGQPQYPVPQTLMISSLMNHVYKGDYTVLVPLNLPEGLQAGQSLPIQLEAEGLACSDTICVPELYILSGTLMIAEPGRASLRFDSWRAKLPAPLDTKASFAIDGQRIRIGIPLPASATLDAPHFFFNEDKVTAYAAPQIFRRKGDLLIADLARANYNPVNPTQISGVLRLNNKGDGISISGIPGTVPMDGEVVSAAPPPELPPLPLLLAGALLGGLLLNIMPCVFPILSLKALSLARAGGSEREARKEGLAYSAGVILACVALGALLLLLRAGGSEIGWAFQLQEPLVVAALLLLASAITANLLGVFEFAIPGFARASSPQGAFATGLLAAFVATPCTGPFMAAAMGAALLLPVPQALLLFATLGLGIALPFLAIAYIPSLRNRLPRPGSWMVTFRRWMALPMGLTALALFWLASRLGGWSFAIACAGAALALILLLTAAGKRQRQGKSVTALAVGGVAVLAAVSIVALPRTMSAPSSEAASILAAQPFSEEALAHARASGKPVFAYFTADWCLSCKVNEKVAIEREDVRDAFASADVVVLRGDWTRRDPEITRYLTKQGAAGVPLYVWYPAGGGEPQTLPQVLTPSSLPDLVGR